MVAGGEELFRLKLKNLLFEVQQFFEDTLKGEHLSGQAYAQKNALMKQIADFKDDNRYLLTAKEIAHQEVTPSGKEKKENRRYTREPTIRGEKKSRMKLPPEEPPELPDYDPVSQRISASANEDDEPLEDYETVENMQNALHSYEAKTPPVQKTSKEIPKKYVKKNKKGKLVASMPDLSMANVGDQPYVDISFRSVDIEQPDAAGYLYRKRKFFGRQRRWCVLKGEMLFTFQKEGDSKKAESCLQLRGYEARSSYEASTNMYPFFLVCAGKSRLEFWAENEAARLKWTHAIEELSTRSASTSGLPSINDRTPLPTPTDTGSPGGNPEGHRGSYPRESQLSMLYDDIVHIREAQEGIMPSQEATDSEPIIEMDYGDVIFEDDPSATQGLTTAERRMSEPQRYGNVEESMGEPHPDDNSEALLVYDDGQTAPPLEEEEGTAYEPTTDGAQLPNFAAPTPPAVSRKPSGSWNSPTQQERYGNDSTDNMAEHPVEHQAGSDDLLLPVRKTSSFLTKVKKTTNKNMEAKKMVIEEAPAPRIPARPERKIPYDFMSVPPPPANQTGATTKTKTTTVDSPRKTSTQASELATILRARRARFTDSSNYDSVDRL